MQKTIIKQIIKKADGSVHQSMYMVMNEIGRGRLLVILGAFGECYEVERLSDGKRFAAKVITREKLSNKRIRMKLISEIKLHTRAKHKNICELERTFEDQKHVYLILQLCKYGSTFQLIKRRKRLTIPQTQFFIYQLIDALCYLHSRQIIHRDIKLGNLLIDENMNLKLSDFGLATKLQFKGDLKHSACGTPNYIAPEIIKPKLGESPEGHSYQVDIWSTGIILYLFLIGRAPFQTNNQRLTYQKIMKADFTFPESFKNQQAKDLIKKILVVDPSKRYTFQQILAHPFMNPKMGIPSSLPSSCIKQVPKFGIFQKYSQQTVKKAARDASVATLKSSIDLSLQHQLSDNDFQKSNNKQKITDKSKQKKTLLKSVFSSSSLSRSLKKLQFIHKSIQKSHTDTHAPTQNRSAILQSKSKQKSLINSTNNSSSLLSYQIKGETERNERNGKREKTFSEREMEKLKEQEEGRKLEEYRRVMAAVFVVRYELFQVTKVWGFVLSNGYVGTYGNGYQLLYNRTNNIYIQVIEDTIKVLKGSQCIDNQRFTLHKKHITKLKTESTLQCQPLPLPQPNSKQPPKLPYLKKIYKATKQSTILFKLSNETYHAHQYGQNIQFLLTDKEIIVLEAVNGGNGAGGGLVRKLVLEKGEYQRLGERELAAYLRVKRMIVSINERAG